jgi:hypothetical protein
MPKWKRIYSLIMLFVVPLSCGFQRYYSFESDLPDKDRITLIDTDQLKLDFKANWYFSSSDRRYAKIYVDLTNKCSIPITIKDIIIERVMSAKTLSPVAFQSITLIETKTKYGEYYEYQSFDKIEELKRIVNPYLSDKDLKHFVIEIKTPLYTELSKFRTPDMIPNFLRIC